MVENVAGTTLDRIAPTRDLLLSSESLLKNETTVNKTQNDKQQSDLWIGTRDQS